MEENEENYHFFAVGNKGVKEKGGYKAENDDSAAKECESSPPHLVDHEPTSKGHNDLQESEIVGILKSFLGCDNVLKYLLSIVQNGIDT